MALWLMLKATVFSLVKSVASIRSWIHHSMGKVWQAAEQAAVASDFLGIYEDSRPIDLMGRNKS